MGRDRVLPALRVELLEEVGRELGLDFFRIEGLVAAAQREERLVGKCGAGEARDALGAVDVFAASADALGQLDIVEAALTFVLRVSVKTTLD